MIIFHKTMLKHQHHKHIFSLLDDVGKKLKNNKDIGYEITIYYINLMRYPFPNLNMTMNKILSHIPNLATSKHNESLMREISFVDVEEAIMSMQKSKLQV